MNVPHPAVSPLRQRMLEDMRMRRLAPKTQTAYMRWLSMSLTFRDTTSLARSPVP